MIIKTDIGSVQRRRSNKFMARKAREVREGEEVREVEKIREITLLTHATCCVVLSWAAQQNSE